MRFSCVLFIVVLLCVLLNNCNSHQPGARAYYAGLMNAVHTVCDSSLVLNDAIHTGSKARFRVAINQYQLLLKNETDSIASYKGFDNDCQLKASATQVIKLYKEKLDTDFKMLLQSTDADTFTTAQVKTADSLYAGLIMAENKCWKALDSCQTEFEKKYGLQDERK